VGEHQKVGPSKTGPEGLQNGLLLTDIVRAEGLTSHLQCRFKESQRLLALTHEAAWPCERGSTSFHTAAPQGSDVGGVVAQGG
jgi:hypothetical protein